MPTSVMFRVEHHETREGPYNNRLKYQHRSSLCWRHPMPMDDIALARSLARYKREYGEPLITEDFFAPKRSGLFAFPNVAALRRWFTARDRTELRAHGFVMRPYRVLDARAAHGSSQSVFHPDYAEALDAEPLPE